MDSDRELLQAAAKAAGIDVYEDTAIGVPCLRLRPEEGGTGRIWDPLTDDGDALRLAVKCQLQLACFSDSATACDSEETISWCHPRVGDDGVKDPYAATRRAIVRAAAELGRRGR